MGGAGFPTSMKWDLVRKQPGPVKYIVCNADESEPGTIKDRFIMTHLPHLLIEGMMLAGLATGAKQGILYIRHEYHLQEEILGEEIRRAYRAGLLGKNILGSGLDFELEVFVSPGGYICGEESALIEAIEGHRAEPRNKPPFPGVQGLWQKPTVINNVETFVNVPQILARGVEWYKSAGRNGSRGLKFVGVSGHTAKPGIFEVPLGITMREVLFDYAGGVRGGKSLKAFAPSGPSSGYLPASMADVRLDFKALAEAGSMLGSGAIVVCDDTTCMLDMALNAVRFYRNESCGKCVPCRVGSQKMVDLLMRWTQGGLPEASYRADLALLDELIAGDEPSFDLRAGPDCASADSISAETFSCGSGCPCFAWQVRERDLFYGGGAGGRGESSRDSSVSGLCSPRSRMPMGIRFFLNAEGAENPRRRFRRAQ